MQMESRRCIKCGDVLVRKKREGERDWFSRRFCSRSCYVGNRSANPIWMTFAERTVRQPNGCIEWTGYTDRKGYGRFSTSYGEVLCHRIAYAQHYGESIKGKHVLHRCDNPRCCNPQHLFLGSNQDNMDDMVRKGRSTRRYGKDNPNYRHGRNCKASPVAREIREQRNA